MSEVDRRSFVGLVGLGGLGSMLIKPEELRAASLDDPLPPNAQNAAQIMAASGVNGDNIAAVRDVVQSTISRDELLGMNDLLTKVREGVKAGNPAPPELDELQQKIEAWLPTLADKVLEMTGAAKGAGGFEVKPLLSDPDRDALDWWSLVHFLSGAALGALCFSFKWTLIILVLWEVIEPWIWEGWNESPINIITDVIVGMLGWFVAQVLKEVIFDLKAEGELAPAVG